MTGNYTILFGELIRAPFQNLDLVWGIVPLYFGWLLNEITSPKASFRTAVQTGFSFIWAAAHWTYQYAHPHQLKPQFRALLIVNVTVTLLVFVLGMVALVSGLRRRYPPYCAFLGHSRFSNYFMIAIFPMQSNYLPWSWDRLAAIAVFAVPIWIVVELVMLVLRKAA